MKVTGFGFKNVWFAARGVPPERLAEALGLKILREAPWDEGIDAAYAYPSGQVFITPPIDSWVLAVGTGLFDYADERTFHQTTEKVARLLSTEVQFFGTHRVVETHAWAKSLPTGIVRAYMYVGDKGETTVDVGPQTPQETDLGFRFFDERSPESQAGEYWDRADLTLPDEQNVMSLAGRWSVDPTALEGREIEPAIGLLCINPSAGKPSESTPERQKPWWKFW